MKRKNFPFLVRWLASKDRKPLVIRGARQVGKTWLVRHLAEVSSLKMIEINFEKRPNLASLFQSNDPKEILLNLSLEFKTEIDIKQSLLFLDEIQAFPELLAKLRWFAEDLPEMPVIAAGSLLEFTLAKHSFSMPVGRINYMHLEPLSFEEFLMATGNQMLVNYLSEYQLKTVIPQAIHEKLLGYFKEYITVGGMPAAVSKWVDTHSFFDLSQVHLNLLATYREDFNKYSGRIDPERLEEVLNRVPQNLGEKFIYSKVNPEVHTNSIKQALSLLCKARVCHLVEGCSANGVPLGAELQDRNMKTIFLDTGLCSASLGLSLDAFKNVEEIILVNRGGIAEQVVGQLLRTIEPPFVQPALYYWQREQQGSSAEVDYVFQHQNKVIPLEVKAGTTGSLKSLHYFMGLKKYPLAVRVNSDLPSTVEVQVKNPPQNDISYTLLSLPFYLLEQVHRLISMYV